MTREDFRALFVDAMRACRELATDFVVEELPAELRFRLKLNCSYDESLLPSEVVFPEDVGWQRRHELRSCDLDTAIDALWRDGRVPEWADPKVVSAEVEYTLIGIHCCGRFTDDENLWYRHPGNQLIFNVGSP